MSIIFKPISIEDSNKIPTSNYKKRRSSYSISNATNFVESFKVAIATGQNQEYTVPPGLSIQSLYIKANDALKWLCDNMDPRGAFKDLRGKIQFKQLEKSVHLVFKTNYAMEIKSVDKLNDVKTAILKFLTEAKDDEIFKMNIGKLNSIEEVEIKALIQGYDFELKGGELIIIK